MSTQSEVKRIALYARVSTSNGHQDPEMQLQELREYARETLIKFSLSTGSIDKVVPA